MLDRYNARKPLVGTLYLTATHLIFVDPDCKKETWVNVAPFYLMYKVLVKFSILCV